MGDEARRRAERQAKLDKENGGETALDRERAMAEKFRYDGPRHGWLIGKLVVIDGVRTSYVAILEQVREFSDGATLMLRDPYALESLADRSNQVAIGKPGEDGERRFEIYSHAILGIGEAHF